MQIFCKLHYTITTAPCVPSKKKEGKWENKINALQLFLVRFHQNMFNYVFVQLKWFSFCHSAQTYIFYQVKNFSDDSSLQNYYILLQKKEEILLGRKVDKSLLFCDIFGIILGQKTNNLEERRERTYKKMPLLTRSLEKKTFSLLVLRVVNCLMLCRILVES